MSILVVSNASASQALSAQRNHIPQFTYLFFFFSNLQQPFSSHALPLALFLLHNKIQSRNRDISAPIVLWVDLGRRHSFAKDFE